MYTLEDLQKAFEAGRKMASWEHHENEFHIGAECKCGAGKDFVFPYKDFEEWVSQGRPSTKRIKV